MGVDTHTNILYMHIYMHDYLFIFWFIDVCIHLCVYDVCMFQWKCMYMDIAYGQYVRY